jgi:hypothetical protein|tara:strand:+ start:1827 stop:2186 length:360 start_codon:yes stop_codon:yes gene_type:complete
MAKLLETKLPIATGDYIPPDTFNRMTRILELSLNRIDIDATVSANQEQRDVNKFGVGFILWNLTTSQLQLWTGTEWVNIYKGDQPGVEGVSGLGTLSVSTNGNTVISLGSPVTSEWIFT